MDILHESTFPCATATGPRASYRRNCISVIIVSLGPGSMPGERQCWINVLELKWTDSISYSYPHNSTVCATHHGLFPTYPPSSSQISHIHSWKQDFNSFSVFFWLLFLILNLTLDFLNFRISMYFIILCPLSFSQSSVRKFRAVKC